MEYYIQTKELLFKFFYVSFFYFYDFLDGWVWDFIVFLVTFITLLCDGMGGFNFLFIFIFIREHDH